MSQVKLGDKNIPFIYQGNELLYPNPVKDGLVLYYDFKGVTNNNRWKKYPRDLSGNGLSASLYNSAYNTEGSGYIDGLHFDGIDDFVSIPQNPLAYQGKEKQKWTVSILATIKDSYTSNKLLKGINNGLEVRISGGVYKALNFIGSTSRLYLYSNSIVPVNEKCHITYSYNYVNKKNRIYINGVLDSELIIDDSKDKLEGMLSVLELSPNRDNVIHSLQIYNRILSEQEIQHNYQLEKERWGL
ncbi:MAG: LamG domain-containing protein [Staphylococcus equorum]|uniref:LamG-like jellyroll fold domain-containing protein n=1 Tax=Staphylococcus TaxID=1279 RepID=UPI002556B633|nr:LamG-like jellyroll fold domain-containing protein [Staphylococcus equorum]MDK9870688.1 hypothetical protein [Staphylococcus equorum]MDK9876086.1 hypothetical protein [Staphylococcus equorum]MDN6570288.1 LamG domain-containing protein [Staphylococcus equorum]MDN6612298.1 LamG domain-containing protein [Staphylococcus equorum]